MPSPAIIALIAATRVEAALLDADAPHADDRGAAIIETRAAKLRELADEAEREIHEGKGH